MKENSGGEEKTCKVSPQEGSGEEPSGRTKPNKMAGEKRKPFLKTTEVSRKRKDGGQYVLQRKSRGERRKESWSRGRLQKGRIRNRAELFGGDETGKLSGGIGVRASRSNGKQ